MTNSTKAAKAVKTSPKAVAKPEVIVAAPVVEVETVAVASITLDVVENPGKAFKVTSKKIEFSAETKIKMLQANPKRPSSKIYKTYENYKSATTVAEYAAAFGKGWQAGVKYDYQHGFLTAV